MGRREAIRPTPPTLLTLPTQLRVERETGIEPATNSLEGCDSTTELLPRPEPRSFALPFATVAAPDQLGQPRLIQPPCGATTRPDSSRSSRSTGSASLAADNAKGLSAKRCCGEGLAPPANTGGFSSLPTTLPHDAHSLRTGVGGRRVVGRGGFEPP